jgi:hypothetical protein
MDLLLRKLNVDFGIIYRYKEIQNRVKKIELSMESKGF